MTTLRRSSALVLVLAITALAPAAASAHDPILFVHGWNSNSSTWNTMISRFTADGWTTAELNNWSYNYNQSNATTASQNLNQRKKKHHPPRRAPARASSANTPH